MSDVDIEAEFSSFQADLIEQAGIAGDDLNEVFFYAYERVAAENGDCIDLEHAPARLDGIGGYQIDGFAFDVERGALYLAICDFHEGAELEALNSATLDRLKQRLSRFCERAAAGTMGELLSPADPAFAAASLLVDQIALIKRIRAVIFSNARLATRRPPEAAGEIVGIPVVYNVLDFTRFAAIDRSRSGSEPITIDLEELGQPPLVCLPASAGSGRYQSYLIAVPGETLAAVYGLYGPRLLEQNVRTFLQARTKVNQGIIRTIRETPEMFLAYNNGITATASSVTLAPAADGALIITALEGLQIVNGGQTTASILYAKDKMKAALDQVFVQMKLTIVDPERIDEIVPKISRFANTQNRISEADFFSSHPLHITLEQISRRITAPPRPGSVSGSKWFYERARGQYREAGANLSGAAKARFETEYPKVQMIDKTALAKHELTFECRPHTVCSGAQKCFLAFAELVAREWEVSSLKFNDTWFRNAVAKAILFRWTDQEIARADWYRADRAFKSQTVTYTLAWLVNYARRQGKAGLNLGLIWSLQDVPDELAEAIRRVAPQIAEALRNAPSTVRNIGEYAKLQACWAAIANLTFEMDELPDIVLIDADDAKSIARDAVQDRKVDLDIAFDTLLLTMGGRATEILALAQGARLLSPKSDAALRRLARGEVVLPAAEKTALRQLLDRLLDNGIEVPGVSDAPKGEDGGQTDPSTRTLRITTADVRRVKI